MLSAAFSAMQFSADLLRSEYFFSSLVVNGTCDFIAICTREVNLNPGRTR